MVSLQGAYLHSREGEDDMFLTVLADLCFWMPYLMAPVEYLSGRHTSVSPLGMKAHPWLAQGTVAVRLQWAGPILIHKLYIPVGGRAEVNGFPGCRWSQGGWASRFS